MIPRTVMLDRGLPLGLQADWLGMVGPYVTHAKIGWGLARVIGNVRDKVALFQTHDITVFCGGTLFEYHYGRGELDLYLRWMRENGFRWLEVSDGTIRLPHDDKLAAIRHAAGLGFRVVSEVGRKRADEVLSPSEWRRQVKQELAAGARWVHCEARESGTVGIFDSHGRPRHAILDAVADLSDRLVFEAPTKAHQLALIRLLGPDVHLGNIAPEDVLPLETLRRGLRSETLNGDLSCAS